MNGLGGLDLVSALGARSGVGGEEGASDKARASRSGGAWFLDGGSKEGRGMMW